MSQEVAGEGAVAECSGPGGRGEWVSFVLKVLQQQMEKGRDIGKRVEEEVPAPFPHRHTGLAVTYRLRSSGVPSKVSAPQGTTKSTLSHLGKGKRSPCTPFASSLPQTNKLRAKRNPPVHVFSRGKKNKRGPRFLTLGATHERPARRDP